MLDVARGTTVKNWLSGFPLWNVRTALVSSALTVEDSPPHKGKAFVEPKFFPHFIAFLPTQSSPFDEAVNPAMSIPVFVPFVIEPGRELEQLQFIQNNRHTIALRVPNLQGRNPWRKAKSR